MDAFTPGYVEAPEDVFSSFRPSGHGMKIWEREAQRRAKRWVWPQYVVKPPYIEGTFEEGRFLISLLGLRPDDPELTHPRSQGARVETRSTKSQPVKGHAAGLYTGSPECSVGNTRCLGIPIIFASRYRTLVEEKAASRLSKHFTYWYPAPWPWVSSASLR